MALSFHFKFSAPAEKTASELEGFLKTVESETQRLGFDPTTVLNASFDSEARREFARRLTTGERVESESLKGVVLIKREQFFTHDSVHGTCRVIPEVGVILVVTNENQQEIVFGFFRYPQTLVDVNDRAILDTNFGPGWRFRDFVDTPDPRYRAIVQKFADADYLESSRDEYE
jgi:hypothetical protein